MILPIIKLIKNCINIICLFYQWLNKLINGIKFFRKGKKHELLTSSIFQEGFSIFAFASGLPSVILL